MKGYHLFGGMVAHSSPTNLAIFDLLVHCHKFG